VRDFARLNGAQIRYEYRHVLTDTLNLRSLPQPALDALRRLDGVLAVFEDVYHEDLLQLDESVPLIRGLQSQITDAGFSANGSGARICVVDTGVSATHLMYADRIDKSASYDFVHNDSDPQDDQGHGTHVAGIALGRTGLAVDLGCEGVEPFQGVAPDATLIAMKVLDAGGGGLDSDVAAGIDRCVDPALPGGPADVINLSLGGGSFTGQCDGLDAMADAANDAVVAGAVVVAAAGNEGKANGTVSPACGSKVIAVAATYKDAYPNCENPQDIWSWCFDFFCFNSCSDFSPKADDLVCFSNRSAKVDVAAPGCSILSADFSLDNAVSEKCGTSMATPHVAGLAALLVQSRPGITPVEVRRAIREGAVDKGPAGFDTGYGYGRIDVLGSLARLAPCTSDASCDDGAFCNGMERCVAGACELGAGPCTGQLCDETAGECYVRGCDDDGVCESSEDCVSCPSDCASSSGAACGNGVCEAGNGEDCVSCRADCAGKQDGLRKERFCCGDGGGVKPVACSDARCGECVDTPVAASCCGDGTCTVGGESSMTCAVDCGPPPVCGDGVCDSSEVGCACLADCAPPLEICNNGTDDNCNGAVDCADAECLFDLSCSCSTPGTPCSFGVECCSGKCSGRGTKTCR
jgi:hypothetical protein